MMLQAKGDVADKREAQQVKADARNNRFAPQFELEFFLNKKE